MGVDPLALIASTGTQRNRAASGDPLALISNTGVGLSRRRRRQPRISEDEARRINFEDSLTLGIGNHLDAAGRGLGAALQGGDFGDAYSRRVRENLDRLDMSLEDQPGAAFMGQMAGFAPWMFVPVGGEAAGARVASVASRAGTAATRSLSQRIGSILGMEGMPYMRTLTRLGEGGGPAASAAQYARAAYVGGLYGAENAATHSRNWEEFQQRLGPSIASGAVVGPIFKGVGQTLGARDPALRMLAGGSIGGVLGGGANVVSHPDEAAQNPVGTFLEGAERFAPLGALTGYAARPAFTGFAASENPMVRAGSAGFLGTGAGYLYANAHNAGTANLDEQMDPGQTAMNWGGVAALAGVGGRPVARNILEAWRNPTRAFGGHAPMSFFPGVVPMEGRTAQGLPRPPAYVARQLETAIRRSGASVDDVEREINSVTDRIAQDQAAGRQPIGATPVDLQSAPEFANQADTLANMPGATRTDALALTDERVHELPQQLRSDLREFLGGRLSPAAMQARFENITGTISNWYNRLFDNGTVRREVIDGRLRTLASAPEIQPTLRRILEDETSAARLAEINGQPPPRPTVVAAEDGTLHLAPGINGRGLQNVKTALDADLEAAANRANLDANEQRRLRVLDQWRQAWRQGMNDAIPGYNNVTGRRRQMFQAAEMLRLDENGRSRIGRIVLGMRPAEIERFMETAVENGVSRPRTRLERYIIKMAVADELLRRISAYVSELGGNQRNAAQALAQEELQQQAFAVFGHNESTRQFFERAMERGRQLNNARNLTGNSRTANRVSNALDQTYSGMMDALRFDLPGALARTGISARALEERNNALGKYLLADFRRASDRRRWRAALPEIRKIEQERIARGAGAGAYGIGAGSAGSWDELRREWFGGPGQK